MNQRQFSCSKISHKLFLFFLLLVLIACAVLPPAEQAVLEKMQKTAGAALEATASHELEKRKTTLVAQAQSTVEAGLDNLQSTTLPEVQATVGAQVEGTTQSLQKTAVNWMGLNPTQTPVPTSTRTPTPPVSQIVVASEDTGSLCNWWLIGQFKLCDILSPKAWAKEEVNLTCTPQCVPEARSHRDDLYDRLWSKGITPEQILKDAMTMPTFPYEGQQMQVRVRDSDEPPMAGDLVIWSSTGGCDAWRDGGHIGYNTTDKYITIIDSNWGTPLGEIKCWRRDGTPIPQTNCMKFITKPFPAGTYPPTPPPPVERCSQHTGLRKLLCQWFGWK